MVRGEVLETTFRHISSSVKSIYLLTLRCVFSMTFIKTATNRRESTIMSSYHQSSIFTA
jgi:hypothetical protein